MSEINRIPKPRIVLADDDQAYRAMLRRSLVCDGYDVLEISTGDHLMAALERAFEGGALPDMVISDQRMPGMPGLGVLARARSWGWTIPFLLITGFGDERLEQIAGDMGVTMLAKPFDIDDFRTIVRLSLDHGQSGIRCITCGSVVGMRTVHGAIEGDICQVCVHTDEATASSHEEVVDLDLEEAG